MLIDKAFRLAAIYHHGQNRKYTGEPYIVHPVDVMAILAEHLYFGRNSPPIQHMLAAALLHDHATSVVTEAFGKFRITVEN